MPLNDYKCSKCEMEFHDILAKDELTAMQKIMRDNCPMQSEEGKMNKSACPLERMLSTANFGDPVRMGRIKPSREFTQKIDQIKKANPRHRIKS